MYGHIVVKGPSSSFDSDDLIGVVIDDGGDHGRHGRPSRCADLSKMSSHGRGTRSGHMFDGIVSGWLWREMPLHAREHHIWGICPEARPGRERRRNCATASMSHHDHKRYGKGHNSERKAGQHLIVGNGSCNADGEHLIVGGAAKSVLRNSCVRARQESDIR